MNNLTKALIHEMARRTNTTVTPDHLAVLDYAYAHYGEHRVGPLYQNLARHTGYRRADVERLFPSGLLSVYTWVGIPIHKPDGRCKPMAKIDVEDRRDVYLDHNATTYVRDEIRLLLANRHQADQFGNPSSSSDLGRSAHDEVSAARDGIAECLGVAGHEIVFTGCGSEANNLAIKGTALRQIGRGGHIITSATEHSAVLEPVHYLAELGFDVTVLGVGPDGRVSSAAVASALRSSTILVAIMAVNNEIGVINPIPEIGAVCRQAAVPFFVDAIQGFGKTELRPKEDGITMLSLSGHKIYAPKGVGALYVDDEHELLPLVHGGGQEYGRRAGTENVDAIVALAEAARLAHVERAREQERMLGLRAYFLQRLFEIEPGAVVNGSLAHRAANNLNIGFPDVDSGSLLLSLNQIGIAVSAGSACHAGGVEASHVLRALAADTDRYGSLRFSFGLRTTEADLDYLFRYLGEILSTLRGERDPRSMH